MNKILIVLYSKEMFNNLLEQDYLNMDGVD
jgi:hypothetical protein